jgi:ABC-2 type transport system permease protein
MSHFQDSLSDLTGQDIEIQMVDELVYPNPEELGFTTMVITGLVTGVMTTGLILVPLLILEEKENHTMDVLFVSPAKKWQILSGKFIAGTFFSLSAGLVMLIFSKIWIVHWGIVFLGVLLGSTSAVCLGLLLGTLSNNPTTINLWAGIAIILFLFPVFIWTSHASKISPLIRILIQALPSVAMSNLVMNSLFQTANHSGLWGYSAILIVFSGINISLVRWHFSKMDS